MARFQAQTNVVLDQELEEIRERLGLEPSQKAELLREVAAIAAWVVRQAEKGRTIEARRGAEVAPLDHPAVKRLAERSSKTELPALLLSDDEVERLGVVLERPFEPTPAMRTVLASLAEPRRHAPKLRWKKSAA